MSITIIIVIIYIKCIRYNICIKDYYNSWKCCKGENLHGFGTNQQSAGQFVWRHQLQIELNLIPTNSQQTCCLKFYILVFFINDLFIW